jgi:lipopolysaccharide export LptBFGC system permease protein LptF
MLAPRGKGEETRFETFWQTLRENAVPKKPEKDLLTGASLQRLRVLARTEAENENLTRRARTEFHRRFAAPVASLFFGLLAVPLVLIGRRSSRAAGGVVGLLVTVIYYGLMQLGDGLVQAGVVSVGVGVWLPNVTVGVLALGFLWRDKLGLLWGRNVRRLALRADAVPSLRRAARRVLAG